jgi:hypothetical protein
MLRLQSLIGLLGLAWLVVGCGDAAGPGKFSADFKTAGFFTQMKAAVDNSGMDAGTFVHKLQRTWYSANVEGALGMAELPIGTTAMKETYDAAGVVGGVFVMIKQSKDTWRYEARSASGDLMADAPQGDNVAACHGCHTKGKSTDYLLGTEEKN